MKAHWLKHLRWVGMVVIATLSASVVALALAEITSDGIWPKNWPKELEPLRKQSRSLVHDAMIAHELSFTNRAQFEAAWPHILSVKTKGAPLTLLAEADNRGDGYFKANVRIYCPKVWVDAKPGEEGFPGGKRFSADERVEIQLFVGGDIVDLNRIPLPADTPIIDQRFKETSITK